ncbi:hypothetical protein [Aeromicrobium marinum]|uniref:hypothetical protein n=1 Tax=Aeromicrobium marinum TaxID=219314 RepID=UPI00058CA2D2|nr:hypothetical protein [Aeromicrobium marinum]
MRRSVRLGVVALASVALAAAVTVAGPRSAPAAAATTGCSEADARAASQKYLDALLDRHAAWSVPAERFVLRVENGVPTAFTAFDLKLGLYLHLQYSLFSSIENLVWTWQPDGRAHVIRAVYDLPIEVAGRAVASSTVVEDFTLTPACLIKRIDATFTVDPPG